MGIETYYDVRCDRCKDDLSSVSSSGPHPTEADATQDAADRGWLEQGPFWTCRDCLYAMKEDHDRGRAND